MVDEVPAGQPVLAQVAVLAGLQDEVVPDLVDVLLDRQEEAAEPVGVAGDEIEIAQTLADPVADGRLRGRAHLGGEVGDDFLVQGGAQEVLGGGGPLGPRARSWVRVWSSPVLSGRQVCCVSGGGSSGGCRGLPGASDGRRRGGQPGVLPGRADGDAGAVLETAGAFRQVADGGGQFAALGGSEGGVVESGVRQPARVVTGEVELVQEDAGS